MQRVFKLNRPSALAILHLLSVVTGGGMGLVAVVLGYAWRERAAADWRQSHYRFHIRTFWYSVLFWIVGWMTWWLLGLGFLILGLIGLAVAARSILALAAAQRHEPVPDPTALIW